MIDLLTILAFNSLYIYGLWNSANYTLDVDNKPENKEIMWWLSYYTKDFHINLKKPIIGCIICMASLHSYPFWFFNELTYLNVGVYILYIFALSGLNALIYETVINK